MSQRTVILAVLLVSLLPLPRGLALGAPAPSDGGTSRPAGLVIRDGQSIAFLGDSITAQGWSSPHGYVRLVVCGLAAHGVKIKVTPAGAGGNTSADMLARLGRDVIDKKPDWVTISCGMNDVIHGARGVPLEQYRANMTGIVERCQNAGIRVILLSTTLAGKPDSPASVQLGQCSHALRELAKEKNCVLADLYPAFVEASKAATPMTGLTYDGVHLSQEGNVLLARTLLATMGLNQDQVARAHDVWLDLPDTGNLSARVDVVLNKRIFVVSVPLTMRQRARLQEEAKAAGRPTLMHWSKELLVSPMKQQVKPAGPHESLDAIFDTGQAKDVQAALQKAFEMEIGRILSANSHPADKARGAR